MTLDTLTPRYGNATDEKQTDERTLGLRDALRDRLGDDAAVYREPDADRLTVEVEGMTAELYAEDAGISVSYALAEDAGVEAIEAVGAVNEAVLPRGYQVVDSEEYGPVEMGPRDGESVRQPTFL